MKCIETYDGKEFWISDQKAKQLQNTLLHAKAPRMIQVNGSMITTNSISGILDELDMKEKEYRKQGMYVCNFMRWHYFKETCNCRINFIKYGIFETESAEIKSKQLLEFEKMHGKLELNLDENYYPKSNPKIVKNISL